MGAGHDGAAKELRRRLEASGHRVEVVDFLDAVAFHIGPLLRWFYQVQLRMAPWSYELSYKLAPALRAPAVMLDTWLTRRKLKRVIKDFRPDAIVSVYPLASLVLGRMRPSTSDASGYTDTIASGRNSLMIRFSLRRVSQVSTMTVGARSSGDSL